MNKIEKVIKENEEEFEKEFIRKNGTNNSWHWEMKGYHPFVIRDFNHQSQIKLLEAVVEWVGSQRQNSNYPNVKLYDGARRQEYGHNNVIQLFITHLQEIIKK